MSHLLCAVLLSIMITPPPKKDLPDQFYTLPAEVRETATVIFSGVYTQGRSPCQFLPDGSRRWFLTSGFRVKDVYRGKIGGNYIETNKAMLSEGKYVHEDLVRENRYLVLLRPSTETVKRIETGKWSPGNLSSVGGDEVIAILNLK